MAKDLSGWKEIQAKFARGAEEHRHLCAHWDHLENRWSLADVIPDPRLTSIGGVKVYEPPVENLPATELFKDMARNAVRLLGEPIDGAPAWHVWLDTMKKRKRGFHQEREVKTWTDTRRVLEEGAQLPPSAYRVHEDGSISAIFKESADFCADLGVGNSGSDDAEVLGELLDQRLSDDQKRRLAQLEERLGASLQAYEQMRLIADPGAGGWQRVGSGQSPYDMAQEIRKLERDMAAFATGALRVVAEALMPISSAPILRSRLETYAHDLVEWLLERVNEQDLPLLDGATIQDAVNREVSSHVQKARKESPPPWRPATGSTSGAAPSQRFSPTSMHHATKAPVTVYSAQEEAALGPEWSRDYIYQEYPKVRHHWSGKEITVKNSEEEASLGGGWANSLAEFAPYKGPRTGSADHNPERWVDQWAIPGLSPDARNKVRALLWRADSEFWKSPDTPSADTAAMRIAFDGVANALFAAGILTDQLLREQLPLFVWESAIAAGWWRLASESPNSIFREQLGRYWVWREEGKDWQGLFRSETGKWRAQLLECAPESPKSASANNAPDVDAVRDTFRTIAGMRASDRENRGFWLTAEIFPSLASFVPEKLGWAVAEIVDEHEVSIRKAVIEALNVLRSSNSDQVPSTLVFDAVVEMGTELFNEALGRMDWMDDYNPPEAYDDAADALYQDAVDFVVRKYKSLASEIPGLSTACDPARLDALRTEWLQIREEAKQETHEWARKIRESRAEADRLWAGSVAASGSEVPAKNPGHKTSGEPEPAGAPSSSRNRKETPPGSMDRVEMTDPIWDFSSTKGGQISIKRLSGKVDKIDPSVEDEPDDADLNPEEELRISEATMSGRSELRTEIETAFSGSDWPPPHAILQAFRSHAVKVFDVNAAAYRRVIAEQGRDATVALNAMSRNLLVGLFGREWEHSPGERVIRVSWDDGPDGWKGQEIEVIAGNDPDPTCLYHRLVGDAVTYRYRFHAPPPPPTPGEPPGINVTNLEWWKYIGLRERHNVAMAVKPYLEDRVEHWKFIYSAAPPTVESVAPEPGKLAKSPAELAERRGAVVNPILTEKRWSRGRWATEAGVGKNSIYEYLEGKRNLSSANRIPMAQVLGLLPEDLPE